MENDDLVARYQQRGVPTDWQDMTPDSMAPAFRLWFRALPSPSSPDQVPEPPDWLIKGAEQAELLIKDPCAALREAGIIGTDETPHISTLVVNHEKTLRRFVMYATVLASTNPSTVGITLAKEEE